MMTNAEHDWSDVDDAVGRISTLPGSPLEATIQDRFGHMEYVPTQTPAQGVQALAVGELDAYLGPLAIVGYQVQQNQLQGLRPVGEALSTIEVGFWAVQPDAIAAVDMLRGAITDDEARVLYVKWTGFDLSAPRADVGVPAWLPLAGAISAGAVGLLAIGLLFQRNQMRRVKAELAVQEERSRFTQVQAELDATKEMDQFRNDLVNRTVHEIATPMTAVVAAIAGLRQRMDSELESTFELVDRNMQRIGATLRALAAAAEMEQGQTTTPAERMQVRELVARIPGSPETEEGMDDVIDVRPANVYQIVSAFLENANEVATQVSVHVRRAGDAIRIEVRDNGPGISPEHLEKIWRPYERLEDSSTAGDHRGMGLYLARLSAQLEGGRVGCDSRVGEGSTFWLELPLVRA